MNWSGEWRLESEARSDLQGTLSLGDPYRKLEILVLKVLSLPYAD